MQSLCEGPVSGKDVENLSYEDPQAKQALADKGIISKNYKAKIQTYLGSNGQIFFNCERNMLLAIQYGGIAYLKHINEGDQSNIEILNSILEI